MTWEERGTRRRSLPVIASEAKQSIFLPLSRPRKRWIAAPRLRGARNDDGVGRGKESLACAGVAREERSARREAEAHPSLRGARNDDGVWCGALYQTLAFYKNLMRDRSVVGITTQTFSTSLPKFSPENSFNKVCGKLSRPVTISSLPISLPAAIQPAISRAASP